MLVALVDDSHVAPVLLDPVTGGVERVLREDVTVAGLEVRGARIATVVTRPGSFGEVAVIDDDVRELTTHTADAVPDRVFPEPTRLRLDGADGTALAGWMLGAHLPASAPLYVDIHGGPHLWWGPATHHANLYHLLLAELGWRVLLLDPRGSDGYGEAFYRGSLSGWGRGDADDIRAAISAVGGDEPDRGAIVVGGYSYGGYLTARLSTLDPRIDAAIIGGGITDLLSLAGTHDLHQSHNLLEFGGDVFADPTVVDENSPIRRVADVTAATLLLHGELDARCPLGQAEQWYRALRHRSVPVELVRYPGADHQFLADGRPSHRVDYTRRIVAWAQAARARRS